MLNRVTNAGLGDTAQRTLQNAMQRLATAQDKASSLKQISRPSDDPLAAAEAMAVRSEQRANIQFDRNAQDAAGWLTSIDGAFGTATTALHKIRDLTVLGANDGALNQANKDAIAIELESLRDTLLGAANTRHMGRNVFAGTSDSPMAVGANYALPQGSASVERRIGATTTIRVDADGAAAFGSGTASVFALVDDIIKDLKNGTNISARIGEVDTHLKSVLAAQAETGVRHATVLMAERSLLDDSVALEARRSSIEDYDLGTAALELKMQEVAYQAALSAAAKTLQPSLMDFLR